MKFEQLKKQLIRTAIICFVALLIAGAAAYATMYYSDMLAEDIDKIRSDTAGNETQYQVTVKQVKESKDALEFYSDFSSSESSDPDNFRRDYAKNLIGKLKDKLDLPDLKFGMEQFQKKDGEYSKKHVSFFASKVTIQLAANSDTDVYEFIKELEQSFPGSVVITSYKISRRLELSDDVLKKLKEDDLAKGAVDAEVIFDWGTILDNPKDDGKAKPGANASQGAPK